MKTTRIKKVLIALDYDQTAQKVAETGYLLAKTMDADVVLLHVIADPVYYSSTEYSPIMGFSGYVDLELAESTSDAGLKKASLHFLEKTRNHLGDNAIQTQVEEGDFAESILKAAKKQHADIIVMGSHSRKWLDDILMGSVTAKVMRETSIPLLIVPTKKQR